MLFALAASPSIYAGQRSLEISKSSNVCDLYIGRLIRAANRYVAPTNMQGATIIKSKGETIEDVLTELINKPTIWGKFNFEQRKEFTFVGLIYGQLQGGSLTTLLILLERDAIPIANELDGVTDSVLNRGYLLSEEGIAGYREKINFLRGNAPNQSNESGSK